MHDAVTWRRYGWRSERSCPRTWSRYRRRRDAVQLGAVFQPAFYRRAGVQRARRFLIRHKWPRQAQDPVATEINEHGPAAGRNGSAWRVPAEQHSRPRRRLSHGPEALAAFVRAVTWRCQGTPTDGCCPRVEDPRHPVAVELFPLSDHVGRD